MGKREWGTYIIGLNKEKILSSILPVQMTWDYTGRLTGNGRARLSFSYSPKELKVLCSRRTPKNRNVCLLSTCAVAQVHVKQSSLSEGGFGSHSGALEKAGASIMKQGFLLLVGEISAMMFHVWFHGHIKCLFLGSHCKMSWSLSLLLSPEHHRWPDQ